jgi:hypothetical protein
MGGGRRTVIHDIRHPEDDQHAEARNENHWVLKKTQWGD